MNAVSAAEQCAGLRLKGSMLPCTVLELSGSGAELLANALADRLDEAPAFFVNMPFVLNFRHFESSEEHFPLTQFLSLCGQRGVHVVGVHQTGPISVALASEAGLPLLPAGATRSMGTVPAGAGKPERVPVETRIVQTPVRSGQQVCAPDGDLVVTAPVSAGAELLAAGNIHVYAPLRGRALAGIRGNESAQIFCQSLEAELLSIAGCYCVCEPDSEPAWRSPVQVRLQEDALRISMLGDASGSRRNAEKNTRERVHT